MKRDKIDDIFSKLIRERDNWTCTRCGKYYPEGQRQGLHCSHFFSRRHKATRWDEDNAAAHCFSCHQYLGGNPVEFAEWIAAWLGEGKYLILRVKHRQIAKLSKYDKEDIYQDLKRRYADLLEAKRLDQTVKTEPETGLEAQGIDG